MSSSSGCAVLPQSLSSPPRLPVLGLKWMFMGWGRGLREVFLLRRHSLLSIVFIALPLPCPRRYQLQCKSKRAFVSHPLAERGGVLLEQSLHSGCIGCIEIIHFDILNMKRYDFLMRNMGWDVLCTPPYHPPECQYCGFSEGCICQNSSQGCSLFCKT